MDHGIEAAQVVTRDGKRIIVVAVRPSILKEEQRRRGVLDVLSTLFPDHQVVLVASTSDGLHYTSESPEVAEKIRRKRSPLNWQRFAFSP